MTLCFWSTQEMMPMWVNANWAVVRWGGRNSCWHMLDFRPNEKQKHRIWLCLSKRLAETMPMWINANWTVVWWGGGNSSWHTINSGQYFPDHSRGLFWMHQTCFVCSPALTFIAVIPILLSHQGLTWLNRRVWLHIQQAFGPTSHWSMELNSVLWVFDRGSLPKHWIWLCPLGVWLEITFLLPFSAFLVWDSVLYFVNLTFYPYLRTHDWT